VKTSFCFGTKLADFLIPSWSLSLLQPVIQQNVIHFQILAGVDVVKHALVVMDEPGLWQYFHQCCN